MTTSDYGITVNGNSYDSRWVNTNIRELINQLTVFDIVFEGVETSDFTDLANGKVVQLYEYDSAGSATLRFLGKIIRVKRVGFGRVEIHGYDYGADLLNKTVTPETPDAYTYYEATDKTKGTVVNELASQNLDGSSPWLITVGTVDNSSTIVGGEFRIPGVSRWEGLSMLAKRVGDDIYINQTTGTLNMVANRGSSTSVKTYYLTGANTNAHTSSHEFTYRNIINDVIGIAPKKGLVTRFQDFSTTNCKLAFSDTRLSRPASGLIRGGGSLTIYVNSTDGFPATGRVLIKNARLLTPNAVFGKGETTLSFDYTSKTSTSLTGTVDNAAGTGLEFVADAGSPILLQDVIVVDDNSSFPASGYLLIGREIIQYSAKASSTTFTVNAASNFKRNVSNITALNGALTSSATTITVDDTSAFASSGKIWIRSDSTTEFVSYTGKTATTFTGCTRGIDGSSSAPHPDNAQVYAWQTPAQSFYSGPHAIGTTVYNYVTTGTAETNSSIDVNGRNTRVIKFENAQTIEDLEKLTNKYLLQHRFGDQKAELTEPDVFQYGSISVGDKITANDSTLSWSSYEVRVLSKTLSLSRIDGYKLIFGVSTYADTPSEESLTSTDKELVGKLMGAGKVTVEQAGTDDDVKISSTSSDISKPATLEYPGLIITSDHKDGYLFSNYIWVDDSVGTAYPQPFYVYGVSINSDGVFVPKNAASAPTGATGGIYYDTSTNKLQFYNGSSWGDVGGAGYWDDFTSYLKPIGERNILPYSNDGADLGSSVTRWNDVYASDGNFTNVYFRNSGGTYVQTLYYDGSNDLVCSTDFIPSSSYTIGTTSSRWSIAWCNEVYGGYSDASVHLKRSSSSIATVEVLGSSSSISLYLYAKGTGIIQFNSNAYAAGSFACADVMYTSGGIYVGTTSSDTSRKFDDSSNGSSSTTMYIGNRSIDTTASDRRLKKNIKNSEADSFALLEKMNIVDFRWKDNPEKGICTGLIAQEVDEYLPQVVKKPSDPKEIGWAVEYHHLVPYLILALKDLNKRYESLEKRLENLERCNNV